MIVERSTSVSNFSNKWHMEKINMKKYYSNTFSGLKTLAAAKTMASLIITHIYIAGM